MEDSEEGEGERERGGLWWTLNVNRRQGSVRQAPSSDLACSSPFRCCISRLAPFPHALYLFQFLI